MAKAPTPKSKGTLWRRLSRLCWRSGVESPPQSFPERLAIAKRRLDCCSDFEHQIVLHGRTAAGRAHARAVCRALRYFVVVLRDLDVLTETAPADAPIEAFALNERVRAVILYESLHNRGQLIGRDVRAALTACGLAAELAELNELNRELTRLFNASRNALQAIRNTVIAHLDVADAAFSQVIAGARLIVVAELNRRVAPAYARLVEMLVAACEAIARAELTEGATG